MASKAGWLVGWEGASCDPDLPGHSHQSQLGDKQHLRKTAEARKANAGGEERIGTESQVLLGCVGINYRGAFRSKVTVSLYWSNSEQNPAPNLCIDLDREFQKLSELCRSMIPI